MTDAKISASLSKAPDVPSREGAAPEDQLTDHEYDGIQEYDNPLPRWWKSIFWGSFWFAVGYFLWFQVFPHGKSAQEEYAADMAAWREEMAEKQMGEEVTEEALAGLMQNDAIMADAANIFQKRCVACHDTKGQGKIGPNLTDDYWIHGKGTLMDIHEVVEHGVPAKGMPAWGRQLTPMELNKVVAYVGTLRGKNIPGKAPQGDKVTAAAAAPSKDATDDAAGHAAPSGEEAKGG